METTTSIYEQANYFFPDSDDSTKLFLRDVLKMFEFFSHPTIRIQFYIAILGLIVTFFHLIILTRKTMITTSVISIMIGVGTCDLMAMIATIIYSWIIYNEDDSDPCVRPLPLTQMYVYWVFINLRELVRRSSTWLGVVMALIRYINLKYWTNTKYRHFSLPLYGFRSFFWCILGSIPFTVIYFFRYDIIFEKMWNPPKKCGISNGEIPNLKVYTQIPSALFTDFGGLFGKIYMFLNGIATKILPCILLPLLTFILIIEIKRAGKTRITANFMKRKKSDKTTGLVIFMTFSFFIVELPIGIVVVLQVAYTELGYL
ncbi:hypothetical protein CRE_08669 [Caenorhabditis remanei]|uniref:G-protein coupled receptors family 1 profile domain-containing protein n=1 Tax=Caenorhabditis remanei TaxID=31234 RepID=E3LJA1_CAERE|nr:hypothetical protein CRE_08669 [Caenorhabditis remanei]